MGTFKFQELIDVFVRFFKTIYHDVNYVNEEIRLIRSFLFVASVVGATFVIPGAHAASISELLSFGTKQAPVRYAQIATPNIQLEIGSSCKSGEALFRVRNVGTEWPESVSLAVYQLREKGDQLISKRVLNLATGQQASFKINYNHASRGKVGLWVDPKWYSRSFTYDASVDCRR